MYIPIFTIHTSSDQQKVPCEDILMEMKLTLNSFLVQYTLT